MDFHAKLAMFVCLIGSSVYRASSKGPVPFNLVQFSNMYSCTTGLSLPKAIADYSDYGCFCGVGDQGTPVDTTDECCRTHDACYSKALNTAICASENQILAVTYDHQLDKCGTPEVSVACKRAEDYTDHPSPECASFVCECDRQASLCFSAERDSYDGQFKGYDPNLCI